MPTTPSLAAAVGQQGQQVGYDIEGAIARRVQALYPGPEVEAQQRGVLAQIPAGLFGAAVGITALPFRAASAFPVVRAVAEPIAEAIEQEGPVPGPGILEQGIRAAGTSLGALGMAALAAPLTGAAAIPLVVGGLFGAAQLSETRGRLEKLNAFLPEAQRLSTGEIYAAAIGAGSVEAVGETAAAFLLQGRFFPKTAAGIAAAREYVVGRLLPEGANKILQAGGRAGEEYVRSLAREVPTEVAQAVGQTAIERAALGEERLQALQQAGAPGVPPTPSEAVSAVVGPTAVASALIPGGVALAQVARGRPQPLTTPGNQTQQGATPTTPSPSPPPAQAPDPAARAESFWDNATDVGRRLWLGGTADVRRPWDALSPEEQQQVITALSTPSPPPSPGRIHPLPFTLLAASTPEAAGIVLGPEAETEARRQVAASRFAQQARSAAEQGASPAALASEQPPAPESAPPAPESAPPAPESAPPGTAVVRYGGLQEDLLSAQFPTIPPEEIREALQQTPDVLQQRLSRFDQMILERGTTEDVQSLLDRQAFYEALLQQHFRLTQQLRPLPFTLPVQTTEDIQSAQAAEAEAVQQFAVAQAARSQGLPVQELPVGPLQARPAAAIEAQITGTQPLPTAQEAAFARRGIPPRAPRVGQPPSAAEAAQQVVVPQAEAEVAGPQVLRGRPGVVRTEENRVARELGLPYLETQLVIEDLGAAINSYEPGFPEAKQPRITRRAGGPIDQATEGKLLKMLADPQFERLLDDTDAARGAPLRDQEGHVISGNLRDLFLKRVYAEGGVRAQRLRAFIRQQAQSLGIDPGAVDAMANPVVRRVLQTPLSPEQTIRFAEEANVGDVGAVDPISQAIQDARRLTPEIVDRLVLQPSGRADYRSHANDGFRRDLKQHVFPIQQYDTLFDRQGNLNNAGIERVERALYVLAYGEDVQGIQRLTNSAEEHRLRLGEALKQKVALYARLAVDTQAGRAYPLHPGPALAEAANTINALEKGESVQHWLDQRGFFAQPEESISTEAQTVAVLLDDQFYKGSREKIAHLFQMYHDLVRQLGAPRQISTEAPSVVPSALGMWRNADILVREQYDTTRTANRTIPPSAPAAGGVQRGTRRRRARRVSSQPPAQTNTDVVEGTDIPSAPPPVPPAAPGGEQQLGGDVPRVLSVQEWNQVAAALRQHAYFGTQITAVINRLREELFPSVFVATRRALDILRGSSGLSVLDANRTAGQGPVTAEEVQRLLFRGQKVEVLDDGTIRVHLPAQGAVVDVITVAHITPSQAELELSTGQTSLAPGQVVVGRATRLGQGLFRIEVTEERTAETLFHEGEHVFEDMGLFTAQDIETLNRTLQRQGQETTAENRANLLAARLNTNTKAFVTSPLMRVIRKVQQFLDRLARLAGIETTGHIVREVRSGALFQREGGAGIGVAGQLSAEPNPLLTRATEVFGTTTNPREAGYLLPDGSLLHMSTGTPGEMAHEQIAQVTGPASSGETPPTTFRQETGAVRWVIQGQSLNLEMGDPFTPAQQQQVMRTIREENIDEVLVDRYDPQTGELLGASRFVFPGDRARLQAFLRPAQGRLQVIDTSEEQPALPGLGPPTPPLGQQATSRQVPPATPRRGATYRTELKSLLEYAAVTNAMSPNQIAYLQQRNDEGHAFFEKPVVPVMYINEQAREIRESWQRDPNERSLFLTRLGGPESATMPRGALASQIVALQSESLDLWQMNYGALQTGMLSPEAFAEFEATWEVSNAMIHYATNAVSEAARVLRMQREDVSGQTIYWKKHQELNEYYRSGKLTDEQKAEFERQLREAFAKGDITTLADMRIRPPTLAHYWWELYYSWLYNVQTWNTNLWTTTGYQLFHQGLVEPLAAGIDRITSRVGQREQQIYADVALRTFTENLKGTGRMLQHAWWLWRGDPRAETIPLFHRVDTPMRRDVDESLGAWERSPHAWMRALAPWVTATSRGLNAGDVAIREAVFNARMRALAEQANRRELGRLDEDWMRDWQQTQVRERTDVFGEVLDYSKELTFHAPMSQVGELIIKKPREMPYGLGFIWRTLFPFAQTPDNLLRRGLELLPMLTVGPWYFKSETLKWAGWLPYPGREAFTPEASMMFAKNIIGTMMAAAVWLFWFQGNITGPAPDDPEEREAMFRRGELPNSVRVGDTWVSWRRFEPISLPLSIALSAFTAMDRLEARQLRRNEVPTSTLQDTLALATVASQAMVVNILDSSYFAGAAQFAQATQRGRETGDIPKGIVRQLATMMTPWSGLQRAMIRAVDSLGAVPGVPAGQTVVRQPEGFWETLMAQNIAGVYTEAGPPIRRDIFGEPLTRRTSLAGELLPIVIPPFERGYATDDPVEQAFQQLRYFPGAMSKTDETGKAYTREAYREMMRLRGALVRPRLDALVNSAGWDRLTPEQQRKAIQQRFSEAARQAKRRVQQELGDLMAR